MSLIQRVMPLLLLNFLFATAQSYGNEWHDYAVDIAQQQIGDTYVAAMAGPDSFDCSGLTQYVYRHVRIQLPRVTSCKYCISRGLCSESDCLDGSANHELVSYGDNVTGDLQPGDLILFDAKPEPVGYANHIGIYEGDNKFIHANGKPWGVMRSDLDVLNGEAYAVWRDRIIAVRRVPSPQAPSTTFSRGQQVAVTDNGGGAYIRNAFYYWNPKSEKTIAKMQGIIEDFAPMFFSYSQGQNVLVANWYWPVDFESGADGWVAEGFLEPVGGGGGGSPMRIEDVPFEDPELRRCVLDNALYFGLETVDDVYYLACPKGDLDNYIYDIQSLIDVKYFKNIRGITIRPNQNPGSPSVSDLTPLASLSQLEFFSITNHNVTDVSPLKSSIRLKTLVLERLPLTDITPLGALKALETLSLFGTKIGNGYGVVTKLPALTVLNLGETGITNVEELMGMTQLESLILVGNDQIPCNDLDELERALNIYISRPDRCPRVHGDCGDPSSGASCSTSLNASSWGLCSSGTVTNFRLSSGRWLWTCAGSGGGTNASCSEVRCSTPTTINGACGTLIGDGRCSSGLTASSPGLCSKGTVSTFTQFSTLYWWKCLGQNGGSDASCPENRCQ